jgi:S1-C subfamily serine protease
VGALVVIARQVDQRSDELGANFRDGIAEQNQQIEALDAELDSARRELERTREDLDDMRQQTSEIESALIDVSGGVEGARDSIVTIYCGIVTIYCGDRLGSGFSIDFEAPPGYAGGVLTNHHVVEDCMFEGTTTAVFAMQGGRRIDGELWTWDDGNDLAPVVLNEHLPPLEGSDEVNVGNPVVAIGSPFGLEGTVTTGVISLIFDVGVQTDAVVNPGNSGGPLLDRNGRVIGVTTFRHPDLRAQGVNFAVFLDQACVEMFEPPCDF